MTRFDRMSPKPLSGRHVLVGLLAFFGIVFAVNFYFAFASLSTNTGLVAEEPYRKGLGYNKRIAADDRQAALHWTANLGVTPAGGVDLLLRDEVGQPVRGRSVAVSIGRPATERFDRTLVLTEAFPGIYSASTGSLGPGNWVVDAEVRAAGGEPEYRMRRRLWLKQ
jgi:nitrogen fixation protein FixH